MRRSPLICRLAAAYAAGILVCGWATVPRALTLAGLCLSALALAAAPSGKWRVVAAIGCFGFAGVLLATLALASVKDGYLARAAPEEPFVTLRGAVASDPTSRDGMTSFLVSAEEAQISDRVATSESVKVSIRGPGPRLLLGDRVEVSGRLRLPKAGGPIDYRAQLLRQGVASTLATYQGLVRRLPPKGGPLSAIYGFRAETGKRIDAAMPRDSAAILRGIMLGDRSAVSDDVNDAFKRSGLAHVLAVSGLHVGLLAGIVLGLARIVRLGARMRRLALVGAVVGYAILTGSHGSVLRAGLMAVAGVVVWMLGRQRDMLASIAVAALCLLTYNPLFAFEAGFQLSFGAVISIVTVGPVIEPSLSVLPQWAKTGVGATLSAQIGVAPLLAIYFNQISIIAPVANLAVVPAAGIALGIGLAGSVTSIAVPAAGRLLIGLSGLVVTYMVTAARFFARLPLAALTVGTPSAGKVVAYYAALACWMSKGRRGNARRGLVPALAVGLLLVAGLAVAWSWGSGPVPTKGGLDVTFLDVGQGDATLLRTAGETVLVDGGPSASLLARNLADEGTAKVDVLLITHEHADHIAGLRRFASVMPVGTVVVAARVPLQGAFLATVAALRRGGARLRRASQGDRFDFADGLHLVVLHPDGRLIQGSESDANNNSLVVRATYGHFALLLTGDVQQEAEREMLREGVDLRADVFKVPHHGSNRGASLDFLRAVAPRVAVISVGSGNTFGHPAPSTLFRLRALDIAVDRTDRQGDVDVVTDGNSEYVRAER